MAVNVNAAYNMKHFSVHPAVSPRLLSPAKTPQTVGNLLTILEDPFSKIVDDIKSTSPYLKMSQSPISEFLGRKCYNSSKFLLISKLGMKNSVIAFSAASVLLISLIIIGTFKTGIVSALTATTTDATSTASDTTTASTSSDIRSSTTPDNGCKLNIRCSARPNTSACSNSGTIPAEQQTHAQTRPRRRHEIHRLLHRRHEDVLLPRQPRYRLQLE